MPTTKRMVLAALLAGALGMALAGPAAAQAKLKVASTLKEIFDNLPLYVGRDGGLFRKHGIEIEVTHFTGGGEVVRAVSGGATDIGMVGTSAAIIAASRGEPLRIFSAWSAPSFGILYIVAADSPIRTVEDLAGKKVGFTRPGSVSHTGLMALLKARQIKVDALPVGPAGDGWAMVKGGRIDATWHTAPDVYSLIDRKEARAVVDIADYLKDYQQGSLTALQATLSKSGDAIGKFLAAVEEANALISANPGEAAGLAAKGMGLPAARLQDMIKSMPKDFFKLGPLAAGNYEGSLAEAVATGGLKQQPTYANIVDMRFFQKK